MHGGCSVGGAGRLLRPWRVLLGLAWAAALLGAGCRESHESPTAPDGPLPDIPRGGVTVRFKETDAVLLNRGMGLYVGGWHYRRGRALPDFVNLVYDRFRWVDLEPAEGDYRFDAIRSFVDAWRRKGVRTGFRVLSTNLKGTQTPRYVFDAGVPAVPHMQNRQVDPVYWDPVYLEKHRKFVLALGDALEGGEGVEFVDVGGVGVVGEMHLGLHIPGMWTREELERYGFSRRKYFDAYKSVIEAYRAAFPRTQLFLNISRYDEIATYAARQGVGLRYDGLSGIRHYKEHDHVEEMFRTLSVPDGTRSRGVPCMYEFGLGNDPSEDAILASLPRALLQPVSYLHLNVGRADRLSEAVRAKIREVGRRIGFRFVLRSVTVAASEPSPRRLHLGQVWRNRGVAPCYRDFALLFSLVDHRGRPSFSERVPPEVPTTAWAPGGETAFTTVLRLPRSLPDGTYELRLALVDPREADEPLWLGIRGRGPDGAYTVCGLAWSGGAMRVLAPGSGGGPAGSDGAVESEGGPHP